MEIKEQITKEKIDTRFVQCPHCKWWINKKSFKDRAFKKREKS